MKNKNNFNTLSNLNIDGFSAKPNTNNIGRSGVPPKPMASTKPNFTPKPQVSPKK